MNPLLKPRYPEDFPVYSIADIALGYAAIVLAIAAICIVPGFLLYSTFRYWMQP